MNNTILHLVDLEQHHDAGQEVINLRAVQRRSIAERRQAAREENDERRSGDDRRDDGIDLTFPRKKQFARPVINREEQLAKLCGMQPYYYGVRVTRARCQQAVMLLDVIYSLDDVPSLPLKDCTETCTCQYQGVKNRRCGSRRLGPPDRRKSVREGNLVRRSCQCRRKDDSGFVFFTTDE